MDGGTNMIPQDLHTDLGECVVNGSLPKVVEAKEKANSILFAKRFEGGLEENVNPSKEKCLFWWGGPYLMGAWNHRKNLYST